LIDRPERSDENELSDSLVFDRDTVSLLF